MAINYHKKQKPPPLDLKLAIIDIQASVHKYKRRFFPKYKTNGYRLKKFILKKILQKDEIPN
jgi:hypothetical protein